MQLELKLRPPRPAPRPVPPAVVQADADELCPDCTYHRLRWIRGIKRCPHCNP